MKRYQYHPLAEIFPLIEGEEFDNLVDSIKQTGLQVPILLALDGRIADGRNRYRACQKLGIKPKFEIWDGKGSLVEKVASLNLHRRHLDKSALGMIGLKLKKQFELEAYARKVAGVKTNLTQNSAQGRALTSAERAAAVVGVSHDTIRKASRVSKKATREVVAAVKSGKLSLNAAEELSSLPKHKQIEIAAKSKKDIAKEVKKAKKQEVSFEKDQTYYKHVIKKVKSLEGPLLYLVKEKVKVHGVKSALEISEIAAVSKLLTQFIKINTN